jgi:preprotein translocase subunit YajC
LARAPRPVYDARLIAAASGTAMPPIDSLALLLPPLSAPGGTLALAEPQPGGILSMLPMFAIIFGIFWFMVIRPERKERKRKAEMLENIKKNDRVLTTFGMYASVAAVNEDDLTLKLDDGATRVRVLKSTIASVIAPQGDEAAKGA